MYIFLKQKEKHKKLQNDQKNKPDAEAGGTEEFLGCIFFFGRKIKSGI